MTRYPRIPTPDAQRQDEPTHQYGLRLFLFVLEHHTTPTLTTEQLRLALHASRIATDARDASTAYYDRVAEARRLIGWAINLREDDERSAARAQEPPAARQTPTPDSDRPNRGPMAPLSPRPATRPPGGHAVALRHRDDDGIAF